MNNGPYIPQPDRQPPHRKRRVLIVLIILVLIAAAVITISERRGGPLPTWDELGSVVGLTEPPFRKEECLAVHFIDVGQGDGVLVQAPTGETMVIDAGEHGNEKKMLGAISAYGDKTLEYVVATHPHSDHIGSLAGVIDACKVCNVLMPRLTESSTPTHRFYADFLNAVRQSRAKTIAARAGCTFSFGEGRCTVLSPSEQTDDLNDMSVVIRLDWGATSFLFTGDAGNDAEKRMLSGKYADDLDTDVLKVAHHGSRTSSSAEFLKAVSPEYAVISVGAGNDYGHPHKETTDKLALLGTTVLRTDASGSIHFYSDGEQLYTETDNG